MPWLWSHTARKEMELGAMESKHACQGPMGRHWIGPQLHEVVPSSVADAWIWRVEQRHKFSTMSGIRPGPCQQRQSVKERNRLKKNQGLNSHRKHKTRKRISTEETIGRRVRKKISDLWFSITGPTTVWSQELFRCLKIIGDLKQLFFMC